MTKTFDNTISELLQDNSSVEYVDAQKSPIATVQNNELIFGQKHNDIDCALCPTAKRACDRAWCTAKNLEAWSEMPKTTLWRWLEKLEKARRISLVSDMKLVKAYHVAVIERLHEMVQADENLMAKYRKIASV